MDQDFVNYLKEYNYENDIEELKDHKDRSIYESNVVEFYRPVTDKIIPGICENRYFVSSKGNTLNLNTGKPIGLSTHRKGYKQFAIMKHNENGTSKQQTKKLHRYIMETFSPLPKEDYKKYEVNHIDGNKNNNNLYNLEWVTPSENTIHAINNNLKTVFGNEYEVQLSYEDVYKIQTMEGVPTHIIRETLSLPDDVSNSLIRNIIKGYCRSNN